MPFIVTTKRPAICGSCSRTFKDTGDAVGHLEAGPRHDGWFHSCHGTVTQAISRHAVATLEEARHQAEIALVEWQRTTGQKPDPRKYVLAARTLDESGGSVGPLPDGTMIHVRAVGQDRMRSNLLAWHSGIDTRNALNSTIAGAWVDAFNARGAA